MMQNQVPEFCLQYVFSRSVMSDSLQLHGMQSAKLLREIFQARMLKWVAISYSKESSQPGIKPASFESPSLAADSLPITPPRKPLFTITCFYNGLFFSLSLCPNRKHTTGTCKPHFILFYFFLILDVFLEVSTSRRDKYFKKDIKKSNSIMINSKLYVSS